MKNALFVTIAILAAASCQRPVETGVRHNTEVYSIKGADTLKIDFYEDASTAAPEGGRPVMIYIHGGGFTTGSRVNAAQQVYLNYLAERGWLGVSVDYRLAGIQYGETIVNPYNVSGTLESIRYCTQDVVDATKYILETRSGQINPSQVCLSGGSAGAIGTLQLIYDCCNGEQYTEALPEGFRYAGAISHAGCIADMQEVPVWKTAPCPIMFIHGDLDSLVPPEQGQLDCKLFGSLYLVTQLEEMGVPYWKWIEKGADHVMAMKPLTNYLEEQYRFLNEFVVKGLQSMVNTEVADKEPAGMASMEAMVKYVPLYILGYGQYLEDIDWANMGMPDGIVY